MNLLQTIRSWWDKSTGFRHAVTTFIGIQIAAPLAQVASWANSCAQGICDPTLLPDWEKTFFLFGFATLSAVLSGIIKWFQNRRAFPPAPQSP